MGVGLGALALALVGVGVAAMNKGNPPGPGAGPAADPVVDATPTPSDPTTGALTDPTPEVPRTETSGVDPVVVVPDGPKGQLLVECRPDCMVFMDQRAIGRGRVEVPASVGRHTISVGVPGSRVNATVSVSEGETTTFCWDTAAKKKCTL